MNQEITHNYVKLEEAFPNADLSALDWIEDKICFHVQKDEEKRLYCQFRGMYIKFTIKDGRVLKEDELDKFKDVLEQQIGYKADCTGTPEKCGEPCVVYRVADEMPLSLYRKLQKELSKLKAQYGKQAAEAGTNLDWQGEATEAGAEGAGCGCREVSSRRDAD